MRNNFYINICLFCIFLFGVLFGCTNDEGHAPDNNSKRLIIIAMDFSQNTVHTNIRDKEINFINKLKSCFESGDNVYLYQITDKSFEDPKKLFNISIPYPGRLETESQVLRKSRRLYNKQLNEKYKEVMDLAYDGMDISGFLLFIEREFNDDGYEKILIIISDGIEDSDTVSTELLIAYGVRDAIDYIKGKRNMADLQNWKVIRTGLWKNIKPQFMKLYDEFWDAYFKETGANYSRVGFENPKLPSILCKSTTGQ